MSKMKEIAIEQQLDIPFDGRPVEPPESQTESDDYCVEF